MAVRLLPLFLALSLGGLCLSCSWRGTARRPDEELILFVSLGKSPFQDSVNTISLDGRELKQLLAPGARRSYVHASGNSLQDILAVAVHEVAPTGGVVDHLFTYNPRNGAWRRLVNTEGIEGAGFLSPDRSRAAFVFAPDREPIQLRLWGIDLKTGEMAKLTGDDTEEGMWDGYASWRPDGQEIAFLRMRRVPQGITSKLMRVPASGGEPTEILDTGENIAAACYGPDGDRLVMLTSGGLEVFEFATKQRKLILPWGNLDDAQYQTGGLIWSKEHDTIAFAVFNRKAKRHELRTIQSDGSNPKVIYTQDESEGKIIVSSFARP
jgi:Tol biopolymer transport system component